MTDAPKVAVIGAGIGGLTSAVLLAHQGLDVQLFESADAPGGKLRVERIGEQRLDAGPTVLTLRSVFDALFAAVGETLDDHVPLEPLDVLARHAWPDGARLDLDTDLDTSSEAIARFAGTDEARRYRHFCARAHKIFATLDAPFMQAHRPSALQLVLSTGRRNGLRGLPALLGIAPFSSLWSDLVRSFAHPRLRQLFARYATYCGSSPYLAPATLMLVAHAERAGVWHVRGGMHRLATEIAALARRRGAALHFARAVERIRLGNGRACGIDLADGERIDVDAVVFNGDTDALAQGLLGANVARAVPLRLERQRSLSAVTWNLVAETRGFELSHHNVFFSDDYAAEFDDIRQGRLPREPTVYVCAQDRGDGRAPTAGAERLLCLVNAPARGDQGSPDAKEIRRCEQSTFEQLARCGLRVDRRASHQLTTTPTEFARMFPGSAGALYGPATHGWRASFRRPGSRSNIPQLYLTGGSVHPGPGLPMVALSGRLAASCVLSDLASRTSTSGWRAADMPGGTSMR